MPKWDYVCVNLVRSYGMNYRRNGIKMGEWKDKPVFEMMQILGNEGYEFAAYDGQNYIFKKPGEDPEAERLQAQQAQLQAQRAAQIQAQRAQQAAQQQGSASGQRPVQQGQPPAGQQQRPPSGVQPLGPRPAGTGQAPASGVRPLRPPSHEEE